MKVFDFYIIFVNLIKKSRIHGGTIKTMAITEIRSRYVDTIGGLIWAVIHPLLIIMVYWFVFSVGFKITPPGGVPFILVFLSGFIPWIIFNETLMANANVIQANSHLVTKTVFPTEILPVVRLLVSMVTHFIMLFILVIIISISDISFSIYNLQFIYYLFALTVLILGLSWLFASINLFFRDTALIYIFSNVSQFMNSRYFLETFCTDMAIESPTTYKTSANSGFNFLKIKPPITNATSPIPQKYIAEGMSSQKGEW